MTAWDDFDRHVAAGNVEAANAVLEANPEMGLLLRATAETYSADPEMLSRTQVRIIVACPTCDAGIGEPCKKRAGHHRTANHMERVHRAQALVVEAQS
jgi:hypothetical protein